MERIVDATPNADIVEVNNIAGFDSIRFIKMPTGEICVEYAELSSSFDDFLKYCKNKPDYKSYEKEFLALGAMIVFHFNIKKGVWLRVNW
jgi:hypothetical protein